MKKLSILLVIAIASCNSKNSKAEKEAEFLIDSLSYSKAQAKTTTEKKESNTAAHVTATFNNITLNMNGKIKQLCDEKNNCTSTIIVKQKNDEGNMLYDFAIMLDNKIVEGTYPLQKNYSGTFMDAVNTITKGEDENKYTTPTTYKQKGGSITLTNIIKNTVSGSFSVEVYPLNDTAATKTIKGVINNLPIQIN